MAVARRELDLRGLGRLAWRHSRAGALLESRFGPSRLPGAVRVAKTMLLVIIGWVFFRAADMAGAWRMLKGMAGLQGF